MPSPSDQLATQKPVANFTLAIEKPRTWKPDTMDLINQKLTQIESKWRFEQVLSETGNRQTFVRNIHEDYLLHVNADLPLIHNGDTIKSVTTD